MSQLFDGLFFDGSKWYKIQFYKVNDGYDSNDWKDTLIRNRVMIPFSGPHIGFVSEEHLDEFLVDGIVSRNGWTQKDDFGKKCSPYRVTAKGTRCKMILCETMSCQPCNVPKSILKEYLQQ